MRLGGFCLYLVRVTPHRRNIAAIVSKLLAWFTRNARDLPWRRTRNPYAIWVSEIMLQQTQVKTVIPYWERWMRQLPDIRALARARPEKVLKLWEGLGYYTRARNLHAAAQLIIAEHGGRFPDRFDQVVALPGIGRYTAGAIGSIAFNQPAPILDGNVIRVLTRLFGIKGNPRDRSVNAKLWALAEELVLLAAKAGTPGGWECSLLNQALMELGALVCTPTQAKCPLCPIRARCVAYRTGQVESLPTAVRQTASTPRRFAAFIVEDGGRLLVRRRPAGVVNAHLWEFPNIELTGTRLTVREAARRTLGSTPVRLQLLDLIRHTITRYRITLEAYQVRLKRRTVKVEGSTRWLAWGDLKLLPFTSAHRKILAKQRRIK